MLKIGGDSPAARCSGMGAVHVGGEQASAQTVCLGWRKKMECKR